MSAHTHSWHDTQAGIYYGLCRHATRKHWPWSRSRQSVRQEVPPCGSLSNQWMPSCNRWIWCSRMKLPWELLKRLTLGGISISKALRTVSFKQLGWSLEIEARADIDRQDCMSFHISTGLRVSFAFCYGLSSVFVQTFCFRTKIMYRLGALPSFEHCTEIVFPVEHALWWAVIFPVETATMKFADKS